MKTKKRVWIFISILSFIVLSNIFFPVRLVLASIMPKEQKKSIGGIWLYTTKHGELQRGQEGLFVFSNSYDRVVTDFNRYKQCHPNSADTVLYRTFALEPWQFWNWIDYFTNKRWRYPYLNPADVQPKLNPAPNCTCSDYHSGPTYY